MERITIAELDIDVSALVKEQANVVARIDELRNSQKQLKAENKSGTAEYVTQAAEIKRLSAIQRTQERSIISLTDATGQLSTAEARVNELTAQSIQSNNQATENTRELIRLRDLLNTETKEGAAAVELINAKIDQNNEFLDSNSDEVTKNRRNVGSYKESIKEAVGELGLFPGAAGGATNATKGLNAALLANPIAAIIALLFGLFKAFSSTQEGADKLNAVLQPLKAIFDVLLGVVQQFALFLSNELTAAFKNPKQAIQDFGGFLVRQLTNRLKGIVNQFGAVGDAIQSLIRLDFEGLKKAGLDFANSQIQILTGVEDGVGKAKAAYQGLTEVVETGIAAGRRLAEIQVEIEQLQIDQAVPLARLRREYEELRVQAENVNRTEDERLKSIDDALALKRTIAQEEQKLLDLQIEQLTLQQSLNDTSREEELQLQQLIARREEIEAQRIGSSIELENKKNAILVGLEKKLEEEVKKSEEEKKKAIAKTNLERQKEIETQKQVIAEVQELRTRENALYIEQLRQRGATEAELRLEQANIEAEQNISRLQAQNQLELLEFQNKLLQNQITKEEFDRLSLAAEKRLGDEIILAEAEAARKRVEIAQAEVDARLSLVSGLFSNIANIFGENSKAGKAAAIAQATIDAFAGANKALASVPFPFNLAAAATSLASGLATVRKITKVNTGNEFKGVESAAKGGNRPKAERGGLFKVGGRRHSAGGTSFFGEDGTEFEAEKDEIIGVLSRDASKAFMNFNDAFTSGSSQGINSFAQGGVVTRPTSGPSINTGDLADKIASSLAAELEAMPNPVVSVVEIAEGMRRRTNLEEGASF